MLSPILIIALIILNRELYTFFLQKKGVKFTILAIPTHLFYYFYSGLSFTICWALHKLFQLQLGMKKLRLTLRRR
jgi:hypothetical protein